MLFLGRLSRLLRGLRSERGGRLRLLRVRRVEGREREREADGQRCSSSREDHGKPNGDLAPTGCQNGAHEREGCCVLEVQA